METFVDPPRNQPMTEIRIGVGETKVVGLKLPQTGRTASFSFGSYGEDDETLLGKLGVLCDNEDVAFSRQVVKLAHSKTAYEGKYNVKDIDTLYVEQNGLSFFQICGKKVGTTNLKAVVDNSPPYASSVPVVVTENAKRLVLQPPVPFAKLWSNRTADDIAIDHPCSLPIRNQCMIRFSTALTRSGVSLNGLAGSKCGGAGSIHASHFTNPYDFINWKTSGSYSWTANPPLQPEPMPGLAAWPFMESKKGVVLFMNYFAVDGAMWGGHIDLWNQDRMGNNYHAMEPEKGQGLGAFFRARKIFFWPLE
jgi:hypothetical protein